ncbi:hypothetical protein PPYR_10121 [Photinus pyralis]|uniref:Uncharacterized protein n=2 Tax=Photinus pyralis TaxID=7054 RepID=A0A5N4AFF0_PHOPY|nr:uncharacterized protein LOC116174477 [Photinus pyralis]KAB0796060.1 hypothetical protein PPYR_10121 [Photinus pyralis]
MTIMDDELMLVEEGGAIQLTEDVDSFLIASRSLEAFELGPLTVTIKASGVASPVLNVKMASQLPTYLNIDTSNASLFEFTLWGYDTAQLHCVLVLPNTLHDVLNDDGVFVRDYVCNLAVVKQQFLEAYIYPALQRMPFDSKTRLHFCAPLPLHESVSTKLFKEDYDVFLRNFREAFENDTSFKNTVSFFFYMAGHGKKASSHDVAEILTTYIRRQELVQLVQLHFAVNYTADATSGGPIVLNYNNAFIKKLKIAKYSQWGIRHSFAGGHVNEDDLPEELRRHRTSFVQFYDGAAHLSKPYHTVNYALYLFYNKFKGIAATDVFASKCERLPAAYAGHLNFLRHRHHTRFEVVTNYGRYNEAAEVLMEPYIFDAMRRLVTRHGLLIRYENEVLWASRLNRIRGILIKLAEFPPSFTFDELRLLAIRLTDLQFFMSGSTLKIGCGYGVLKKVLLGGTILKSVHGRDGRSIMTKAEFGDVRDINPFLYGDLPKLLSRMSHLICDIIEACEQRRMARDARRSSDDPAPSAAAGRIYAYLDALASYAYRTYGPGIKTTTATATPSFDRQYYDARIGASVIVAIINSATVEAALRAPTTATGQLIKAAVRVENADFNTPVFIEALATIRVFPLQLINGVDRNKRMWAIVETSSANVRNMQLANTYNEKSFIARPRRTYGQRRRSASTAIPATKKRKLFILARPSASSPRPPPHDIPSTSRRPDPSTSDDAGALSPLPPPSIAYDKPISRYSSEDERRIVRAALQMPEQITKGKIGWQKIQRHDPMLSRFSALGLRSVFIRLKTSKQLNIYCNSDIEKDILYRFAANLRK